MTLIEVFHMTVFLNKKVLNLIIFIFTDDMGERSFGKDDHNLGKIMLLPCCPITLRSMRQQGHPASYQIGSILRSQLLFSKVTH